MLPAQSALSGSHASDPAAKQPIRRLIYSPAARSSTESKESDPSIPCHHRRSQCEQLSIVTGSPPTWISITTNWRMRHEGHFITWIIGLAFGSL